MAAVCDPLSEKVAAAKECLGSENALQVLAAKKHMCLEKPMAQSIEDCDRIIEAWKGTHTIDLVNWLVDDSPVRVMSSMGLDFYGGNEPNDKRCRDCEKRDTCPDFISAARATAQPLPLRVWNPRRPACR